MSTETATRLTTLGAEFHHAAKEAVEALRHIDEARKERILFLRKCSTDSTARLATLKEEVRTLPEQIANWDAEAARLESQTAEDLLRQALEPASREPSPNRFDCEACGTGVAADEDGCCATCGQTCWQWVNGECVLAGGAEPEDIPEEVEAKADAAERALPRPVENCRHVAADGTCGHPNAQAPECHDGVVCPVKAGKIGKCSCATGRTTFTICDYCKSSLPAGLWTAFASTGHPQRAEAAEEIERFLSKTVPTLLDLTKLPPGTVCEALEDVVSTDGRWRIRKGLRLRVCEFRTVDSVMIRIEFNPFSHMWVTAMQPARVVKEGGEDAPR